MGVKFAGNCVHWSQPSLPRCSSSPQGLASIVSAAKRRGPGLADGCDRSLACQISSRPSPPLGTANLSRRRSLDDFEGCGRRSGGQFLRRAFSASMDGFDGDEEEFVRRLRELALELQDCANSVQEAPHSGSSSPPAGKEVLNPSAEPPWQAIRPEPPRWINGASEMVPPCLEMKANRVDLPLSLRIIKRRKRWEEGVREAGESACCSVKKAFSSMVFIVRELQSYTLQMREALFYEDLEGILARVRGEMNASFVWLFQQIFSCTPTFMVYVMLLLANFTVYSIGHSSAFAAAVSPCSPVAGEQEHQQAENRNSRFDASSIKSFNVVGRTASVGGSGGDGGKVKPVAGATDDDGSHSSYVHRIIPTDGISTSTGVEESEMVMEEEEMNVWSRIVEEATKMQASSRDETLMDSDTLRQLVSPVTVGLEPEDYADYSETELMYCKALSQDPDNVLLLSNFAQFLFLVLHDHDRAEYYFKRASEKKPGDAEALCRYAMFLWLGRKDLEAAEEAYLEAIAADPSNSHYAANYAHFLWNTGGEDTCYPLDGSDAC